MKSTIENQIKAKKAQSLQSASSAFTQEILNQIQRAKSRIYSEYRGLMDGLENAYCLALNEAEALAWETGFPQLVFADLAAEKVAAVAQWRRRLSTMQHSRRPYALGA